MRRTVLLAIAVAMTAQAGQARKQNVIVYLQNK
jgi:hypothetical protein